MPRTVTVKLGGTEFEMPATYRASREIAEKVGDPLRMATESLAGKLQWTQEDVISIVFIGAKHAGCAMSRDNVGEAVVEMGVADVASICGDYIAAIVSGAPQRQGGEKKKAEDSQPG